MTFTLTLFTVYITAQLCHGITTACQVVHAWRAREVTTAGRDGVHYITSVQVYVDDGCMCQAADAHRKKVCQFYT